jgi:RuvA N terminal domain.
MLEYIKGTLRGIEDNNTAIIEIGGFGMAIKVSENTVSRLPELDREVFLYTYTEIRENDIILYGFADKDERQAFIDLTSVNGVGPRMAINILSKYNPDEIYMLISSKNSTALESIPGIGKKTATRIITELEERLVIGQPLVLLSKGM